MICYGRKGCGAKMVALIKSILMMLLVTIMVRNIIILFQMKEIIFGKIIKEQLIKYRRN